MEWSVSSEMSEYPNLLSSSDTNWDRTVRQLETKMYGEKNFSASNWKHELNGTSFNSCQLLIYLKDDSYFLKVTKGGQALHLFWVGPYLWQEWKNVHQNASKFGICRDYRRLPCTPDLVKLVFPVTLSIVQVRAKIPRLYKTCSLFAQKKKIHIALFCLVFTFIPKHNKM